MRCLRITFVVSEDVAGSLLADLAGRVSQLDFEVEEPVPQTKNAPAKKRVVKRARANSKPTMQGSAIPKMCQDSGLLGGKTLDVVQMRKVLADNGLSPTSYSHALILLQNRGLIKKTAERGVYEVIK